MVVTIDYERRLSIDILDNNGCFFFAMDVSGHGIKYAYPGLWIEDRTSVLP